MDGGVDSQLPPDLLPYIFQWLQPLVFFEVVAPSCNQFSQQWYISSFFPRRITVPDDAPTLNSAINRLAAAEEGDERPGLVLVRPGIYAESLRVTQNCHVLGLGARGAVVVEAPGWESALVSAGLGGRKMPDIFGFETFSTGEGACVENMTFRCRNYFMRSRCVYLVNGRLRLQGCDVDGGVLVGGFSTAPLLRDCRIRDSRGNGVHFTDHCQATLQDSTVDRSGRHGILIDRHSRPEILGNQIRRNQACGVYVCRGESCHSFSAAQMAIPVEFMAPDRIRDNHFVDNVEGELCFTPLYAEADADADDSDGSAAER